MAPEKFCAYCGKPVLPQAAFCAFCGASLAAPRRGAVRRSAAVPDRAKLVGPCTVIYAGRGEMEVRRVGRLAAETVKMPLPDVTRQMRTSKGFLAAGLPSDQAASLAERAEKELGAPILVIPDDACVPLPPAMRMRQAVIDADGIRCEAYTWNLTERVTANWDAVFLVCCGRIRTEQVVEDRDAAPVRTGFFVRPTPLATNVQHEYLVDIVLFEQDENGGAEGWRRLRLDQNTSAFSLTEMKHDPSERTGALYRCAVNLDRYAAAVPKNAGVGLLASGAADAAWEPFTFLNKQDFDMYARWLLQLVRYGHDAAL